MIMKRLSKIFALALIAATLITACDIVEEPYLVPIDDGGGPNPTDKVRKVLLEDYTGQKCPNCPGAAELAKNLQTIHGEQLIVIAVHAGFYSIPAATGEFTADYRTPEGNELNGFFDIQGYPSGLVNRAEYQGNRVLFKDSWEAALNVQLELPVQAAITIANDYNSATRSLSCSLETEFIEDLDGTYNICVFLTESGIVSPQQSGSGVIEDYEHNHMLRAAFNGAWGSPVGTTGQGLSGEVYNNVFSLTLNDGWNADHCHVVAFVYNTETLEIVQAEEVAVVE
jgi:thiol-disulfide isomerase/thioredoxin